MMGYEDVSMSTIVIYTDDVGEIKRRLCSKCGEHEQGDNNDWHDCKEVFTENKEVKGQCCCYSYIHGARDGFKLYSIVEGIFIDRLDGNSKSESVSHIALRMVYWEERQMIQFLFGWLDVMLNRGSMVMMSGKVRHITENIKRELTEEYRKQYPEKYKWWKSALVWATPRLQLRHDHRVRGGW